MRTSLLKGNAKISIRVPTELWSGRCVEGSRPKPVMGAMEKSDLPELARTANKRGIARELSEGVG
jgi:hypothetical protein